MAKERKKLLNKNKKIRKMRSTCIKNSDGTVSSHRMAWTGDKDKRRGSFGVFPTITPKEGKESSTNPDDWTTQDANGAREKGELIKVKSKRKAMRLAAGSWKKGACRKEAMQAYRISKKKER